MKAKIVAVLVLILLAVLPLQAVSAPAGAETFFLEAQYFGISNSGCQTGHEGWRDLEYDYANDPGEYMWWDGDHQDCHGISQVHLQVGDPSLPQSMVLWAKSRKSLAVEWNDYIFASGTYSIPYAYLGDANNDNLVDILDYNIVYNAFGCEAKKDKCYDARGDFDNDLVVDSFDFNVGFQQGQFGEGGAEPLFKKCPPICWGPEGGNK